MSYFFHQQSQPHANIFKMPSGPAPEYRRYSFTTTDIPDTGYNTSNVTYPNLPIDEKPNVTLSHHNTSIREGPNQTVMDRQGIQTITDDLEALKYEAVQKLQVISAQEKCDLGAIKDARHAYSKGRKDLAYIKAHAKSGTQRVKHRRWVWERVKARFGDENAGFGHFWRKREEKVEGGYMAVREEVVEEYMVRRRPIIARLPATADACLRGESVDEFEGEGGDQERPGVDEVMEKICGRDANSDSRILRFKARKDKVKDSMRVVMTRMDSDWPLK